MKKKTKFIIFFLIIIVVVLLVINKNTIKQNLETNKKVKEINKKIIKEEALWVATSYPKEILELENYSSGIEEFYENDNTPIFNQDTMHLFIPEDNDNSDLIPDKKEKTKSGISGLIGLPNIFLNNKYYFRAVRYDLEDKKNWSKYLVTAKNQKKCGSCGAFSSLTALEGYVNRKYKNKNKISFSNQYLISYANFAGCKGVKKTYYINRLSLGGEELNQNYLVRRITSDIEHKTFNIKNIEDLENKTQLSYAVGEVPLGIPLEKDLEYLEYDACEIIDFDKETEKAKTNMLLEPLLNSSRIIVDLDDINENFCPDDKDRSEEVYIPKRNDNFDKYFIENHFKIDTRSCEKNMEDIVINIKKALDSTPLIATIYGFTNLSSYKEGIYSVLEGDVKRGAHGVTIIGWGVEKNTNKEYWILRNSWGDYWGDEGNLRIWIGDENLKIECQTIYGFSGNLVVKKGEEVNKALDAYYRKKEYNVDNIIEKFENKYLNNKTKYDSYKSKEYYKKELFDIHNKDYIRNISYETNTNQTNNECSVFENCVSEKLKDFFETKEDEFV